MNAAPNLPDRPPFAVRARLLTPLAAGGSRHELDALVEVDAAGRFSRIAAAAGRPAEAEAAIDIRPWVARHLEVFRELCA